MSHYLKQMWQFYHANLYHKARMGSGVVCSMRVNLLKTCNNESIWHDHDAPHSDLVVMIVR